MGFFLGSMAHVMAGASTPWLLFEHLKDLRVPPPPPKVIWVDPPPMDAIHRARLQRVPQVAGSLRAQRQLGVSLCSRLRSEREESERRAAAAEDAAEEVVAAEEHHEDIKVKLAEGLIQADGSNAPPKRRRQSGTRAPGPRKSVGGEKAAVDAPKRPRPSEGGKEGVAAAAAGSAAKKPKQDKAAEPDKAAAKAAEKAAKKAEKEVKKAAAKKPPPPSLYEPGAVVEVSLRLGEAFANWYEAVLGELVKNRWKVTLQRRDESGAAEPLRLEGRPATEWAKLDMIRPLPPSDVEWSPSVDDICELFFSDGCA